jgi:curved DNA-binding protein CbpA
VTDHYQTLGVPRDASQADIRAAFRRAATEHHPDREGGDAERMAAANRAYETLGDPERRAEYDATGGDKAADRFETECRQQLVTLFDAALAGQDENLLGAARELLSTAVRQVDVQHDANTRRAARLRKRRDRIIRKGCGENLFTGLVDSQLLAIDAQLAQLEHGRKVFARVGELLDEYEAAPEAMEVAIPGVFYALPGTYSFGSRS